MTNVTKRVTLRKLPEHEQRYEDDEVYEVPCDHELQTDHERAKQIGQRYVCEERRVALVEQERCPNGLRRIRC